MGLNISFFKTPKHRVFHYQPIYYDESKERIEKIKNEAEREKALREGRDWKETRYIPGMSIRGSFQAANEMNKRHAMSPSIRKLVTLISLVILFVMVYYFAKYSGWFLILFQ